MEELTRETSVLVDINVNLVSCYFNQTNSSVSIRFHITLTWKEKYMLKRKKEKKKKKSHSNKRASPYLFSDSTVLVLKPWFFTTLAASFAILLSVCLLLSVTLSHYSCNRHHQSDWASFGNSFNQFTNQELIREPPHQEAVRSLKELRASPRWWMSNAVNCERGLRQGGNLILFISCLQQL